MRSKGNFLMFGMRKASRILMAGMVASAMAATSAAAAVTAIAVGGTEASNVWAGFESGCEPGVTRHLFPGADSRFPEASRTHIAPLGRAAPRRAPNTGPSEQMAIPIPIRRIRAVLKLDNTATEVSFLWGSVDTYNSLKFHWCRWHDDNGFIHWCRSAREFRPGLGRALGRHW